MTEAQAIEAIAARFTSQWPTLTAALPGAPYPFALKDEALPSADTFAFCTWKHVARDQITQGRPSRKMSRLLIVVKLWSPANAGGAAIATLAGVVRQIFEGQSLAASSTTEGVTVLAGATGNEDDDARWTMATVTFPAWYFEQS